jgi:hypothetical protein
LTARRDESDGVRNLIIKQVSHRASERCATVIPTPYSGSVDVGIVAGRL